MFEIYKKYGFWTWDMNAFFLMIPSIMWIPVALFFSYRDLGMKLAKFSRDYMDLDALLSGTVKWDCGNGTAKRFFLQAVSIQGDHSACAKPPVDFKTKVPLWPGLALPNWDFCFAQAEWSPCTPLKNFQEIMMNSTRRQKE